MSKRDRSVVKYSAAWSFDKSTVSDAFHQCLYSRHQIENVNTGVLMRQ